MQYPLQKQQHKKKQRFLYLYLRGEIENEEREACLR